MNRRSLFSGLAALAVAPLAGPVTAAIEKRRRQADTARLIEEMHRDSAASLVRLKAMQGMSARRMQDLTAKFPAWVSPGRRAI